MGFPKIAEVMGQHNGRGFFLLHQYFEIIPSFFSGPRLDVFFIGAVLYFDTMHNDAILRPPFLNKCLVFVTVLAPELIIDMGNVESDSCFEHELGQKHAVFASTDAQNKPSMRPEMVMELGLNEVDQVHVFRD